MTRDAKSFPWPTAPSHAKRPGSRVPLMKVSSNFCFVVVAESQAWPVYAEIPYAAWPDQALQYDSYGDCRAPYERDWSCLSVMNWSTHEVIVVLSAEALNTEIAQQIELRLVFQHHGDWVVWTQADLIPLQSLSTVPLEYLQPGNVFIAAFQCDHIEPSALVARLFMRRLHARFVWDGQSGELITQRRLEDNYLKGAPLETGDALTDEVRQVFAEGEAWHHKHPGYPRIWFWWKTPAHVRDTIESNE